MAEERRKTLWEIEAQELLELILVEDSADEYEIEIISEALEKAYKRGRESCNE